MDIPLEKRIQLAFKEDSAKKDIATRSLISRNKKGEAIFIAKEAGVLCGVEIIEKCFNIFDSDVKFKPQLKDGERVEAGTIIARVKGALRSLLTTERLALNFLSHLSGISSLTASFVQKVKPYGTHIYDTRKTTPLWRDIEKYAVRVGGGHNHRINLAEAIFVKDNHIEACGGLEKTLFTLFNKKKVSLPVIVEVCHPEEVQIINNYPVVLILLDNMEPSMIREIFKVYGKKFEFEISGGINLENVVSYARTGIGRISIGALTHSAKSLDISMEYTHSLET